MLIYQLHSTHNHPLQALLRCAALCCTMHPIFHLLPLLQCALLTLLRYAAHAVLQLEEMHKQMLHGCRMEYLFWDAAYHRQEWPI